MTLFVCISDIVTKSRTETEKWLFPNLSPDSPNERYGDGHDNVIGPTVTVAGLN